MSWRAGLLLSAAFGLLAALVGAVILSYSLHTYPAAAIHLARLWILVTPLELLAVTLIARAQAADAFPKYNVYRFLSPFSVLIVLVIEKTRGRLTYSSAAFAYLLGGTPAMIWTARWAWRFFRPTLRSPVASSRLSLSYGVRAWGADLLGTVATQVDRVLVVGLLNPEMMGLYVIAQSAAGVLAFIPTAVAPITMPRSTNLSTGDTVALTGRAARATLCLMLLASLPLLFCGDFLLRFVYGHGFAGAAAILPFLVVDAIAGGLTSVLSQAFLAADFPDRQHAAGLRRAYLDPSHVLANSQVRTKRCRLRTYAFNSLPAAVRTPELSLQAQIASAGTHHGRRRVQGTIYQRVAASHCWMSRHICLQFVLLLVLACRAATVSHVTLTSSANPIRKGQSATLSCTTFYSDGTHGSCVSPVYTDDQSYTVVRVSGNTISGYSIDLPRSKLPSPEYQQCWR